MDVEAEKSAEVVVVPEGKIVVSSRPSVEELLGEKREPVVIESHDGMEALRLAKESVRKSS